MATVYCTNCGQEVRGKFCTNCGTPLETPADQPAADAGATSVLRSEDLLRKAQEELNTSSVPPPPNTAPSAPAWPQQDPAAGQSAGYSQPEPAGQQGWQSPSPQADQGWQSPPQQADQGWQNPTPQAGQGWQQPPPQQPPPPSGGWGSGQQPGATPPPGSGGYYAQQFGVTGSTAQAFSGAGPVNASTDIGQLFSGAWNILMSNMQTVVTVALIYAGLLAAVGIFIGIGAVIGSKVGFIGFLFLLIGYIADFVIAAVPIAAFVYMAQNALTGMTSSPRELLDRARPVLPTLAIALFLTGIVVGIGFILLVIPGIILLFLLVFVPQAVVLDGIAAGGSLGHSIRVVRSDLGTSVVATLVLYVAMAVVGGVASIVLIPAFLLLFIPVIGWAIYLALFGIIYGIVGAFALSYMTLLYNGLKAKSGIASPTPAYTGA